MFFSRRSRRRLWRRRRRVVRVSPAHKLLPMVLGRNLFELWIKNHIQITFGKTWTYSSFHVTLFSWNLILHAKNSNITSKLHFMASMNNYITSLNQMYPNQSTSTYTHAHIYLFWCFLVKVHDLVLTTLVKLIKHLGCYSTSCTQQALSFKQRFI